MTRQMPKETAPAAESVPRPEHSHGELKVLARDLWVALESGDQDRVYGDARRFYHKLVQHMREEDSSSGWFGEVERIAPRMVHRLERLRAQHREILADLRIICAEVDDDLEGVRAFVDECLGLVDRHEQEEEKLIGEVYLKGGSRAG